MAQGTSIGPGVRIDLGNQSKDLLIGQGITIRSTDYDAIWAAGFNQKITVAGLVKGFDDGIDLLDSQYGQIVNVTATGRIIAGSSGIKADGEAFTLTNAGTIQSGGYAINIVSEGIALHRITNSGVINSTDTAIISEFDINIQLTNSGDILTDAMDVYIGHGGSDLIRNSGFMDGRIKLGGGNDLYDGRGGKVSGLINGDDGADRFILGASVEAVHGGNGTDTLDFRKVGAVHLSMDGKFLATGAAKGDTYASIERVYGSNTGNDLLDGSDASDDFRGFGGRDRLVGDDGDDKLHGGTGRDTMTGGNGLDDFVFDALNTIGDTITDWVSSPFFGKGTDSIWINSNFGGGLTDGVISSSQFRSRAGHAAGDANDRFLFDTTTTQLWFDRDGTGSAKAVMVADLQAGAQMTYDDIIIF